VRSTEKRAKDREDEKEREGRYFDEETLQAFSEVTHFFGVQPLSQQHGLSIEGNLISGESPDSAKGVLEGVKMGEERKARKRNSGVVEAQKKVVDQQKDVVAK
jgi:hypothetical protein